MAGLAVLLSGRISMDASRPSLPASFPFRHAYLLLSPSKRGSRSTSRIAGILRVLMPDSHERHSPLRADSRRSQRVLLRIQVLVRAEIHGEPPLTEDTSTVEVNAHGALISLAMKVRPGQKLVLKNWATAIEQECRVVHIKDNPFGKNAVGIAFPYANPRFWNIDFPPPDWKPFLE